MSSSPFFAEPYSSYSVLDAHTSSRLGVEIGLLFGEPLVCLAAERRDRCFMLDEPTVHAVRTVLDLMTARQPVPDHPGLGEDIGVSLQFDVGDSEPAVVIRPRGLGRSGARACRAMAVRREDWRRIDDDLVDAGWFSPR